jgi:hypothetical protein
LADWRRPFTTESEIVSTVTLKFYGRFLFARDGDAVVALAPHFKGKFPKHNPLMSIRHDGVKFLDGNGTQITTFEPMLRLASDVIQPAPAGLGREPGPEVLVWDLSHRAVAIEGTGTSSHRRTADLLDLVELDTIGLGQPARTKVKAGSHRPSPVETGDSHAVVRIVGGAFTSSAINPGRKAHFAPSAASDGKRAPADREKARDARGRPVEKVPVDLMECVVTFPGATMQLQFTHGKKTDLITVRDGAMISFSHLCTAIKQPSDWDLEFAQYYDLVEDNTGSPRLVPVTARTAAATGEGMGCYYQSEVSQWT